MTGAGADSLTDLELVRRAQAGDTPAFEELVARNRRAVFRAALAALGNASEADEVAQEAFVAAYQKLGSFRGEAAFRTWLLSIAWRKAIDRRKSLTRWFRLTSTPRDADEHTEDLVERIASQDRSQEDALARDELQVQLRRLIATLPVKLRQTLLLAGSGDYSYEQIAAMLDTPVGTVKWRVSEAKRVLKKKLEALGNTHG
ncbi:MAG TPA: RNA polymerase sigma factor [Vicinamibacterales bacterium]|nr:RNA polymerase sigma factor [Vicinamibacterales bacterium]